MLPFQHIVLPTDLSENSASAAPYALELARKFGATIHLLHVFEDIAFFAAAGVETPTLPDTAWLETARKERAAAFNALAASLQRENIQLTREMCDGYPAHEIVAYVKKVNADCVVISTHGRTGLSRFLFGSIAERVIRTCPCPVLSICPPRMAHK